MLFQPFDQKFQACIAQVSAGVKGANLPLSQPGPAADIAHGALHASIGPRQGKLVSTEHTLGVGATSVRVWVECRADDVPIVTRLNKS